MAFVCEDTVPPTPPLDYVCPPGALAYVTPEDPYAAPNGIPEYWEIHICPEFFDLTTARGQFDTQGGVVVHEMSHFRSMCTRYDYYDNYHLDGDSIGFGQCLEEGDVQPIVDHVYGLMESAELASTDPDLALTNADNYQYFAELWAQCDYTCGDGLCTGAETDPKCPDDGCITPFTYPTQPTYVVTATSDFYTVVEPTDPITEPDLDDSVLIIVEGFTGGVLARAVLSYETDLEAQLAAILGIDSSYVVVVDFELINDDRQFRALVDLLSSPGQSADTSLTLLLAAIIEGETTEGTLLEDATVIRASSLLPGISAVKTAGGETRELQLHSFNHSARSIPSADCELYIRKHVDALRVQYETIVDALTGERLDVFAQLVPIEMEDSDGVLDGIGDVKLLSAHLHRRGLRRPQCTGR